MRAPNFLGPLLPESGGSRLLAGPLVALLLLLSGCVDGPAAVTGFVHPVFAMIAMVASVTTVLLNSFGGRLIPWRGKTVR